MLIRRAVLTGFPELVAELGGDASGLLEEAAIDPRPEELVPFRAVADVLTAAAATLGRPDLGRVLSRRQGTAVLGPMGALATTAPTLGEGLRLTTTYMDAFAPALETHLDVLGEVAEFTFRPRAPRASGDEQLMELLLVRAFLTIRATVGPGFQPLAVLVPHAPLGPVAAYATMFGVPLAFDCTCAGERIATADLDRPLDADATAHRVVREWLDEQGLRREETLSERLLRQLGRALETGPPSMDAVAAGLGVNVRTLQRRLAEEGTTMRQLLETARREAATRHLRDEGLPLVEVAARLGYSDASVLTRSCRRWFGAAPSEVRRRLLEG